MLADMLRSTPVALGLALACACGLARAADPDPGRRVARVRLVGATVGLGVDVGGSIANDGPVRSDTLTLTVTNRGPTAQEATLSLELPSDAVVGRMALDVDGRWMEGEVLPHGSATRFYEAIVRPPSTRRDPALLVEEAPGQWTLKVFPVPPGGERHVAITSHRLVPAKAGAMRVEALPPSVEGDGRMFASVVRFDRPVGGPLPARIVVAIDTSLSIGRDGLAEAAALTRSIAATGREVRVVHGDFRAAACAGDLEGCLTGLDVGGATDLGALLDAARDVAGSGPAAIVLLSDGRATTGLDAAGVRAAVARAVGERPLAIHALGVGAADGSALAALAGAGRGVGDGDIVAALSVPRRPRIEVRAAADVDALLLGQDVVVIGRAPAGPSRVEVVREDDLGRSRAVVEVPERAAPAFGVARLFGALEAEHAAKADALAAARQWGVTVAGTAMLALEKDEDYDSRGIARWKAVERALELGTTPPAVSDETKKKSRELDDDSDGDGFDDGVDRCPNDPETWNGIQDDDGCPDRAIVRIQEDELRILDKVWFPNGQSAIPRAAMPLLHEVAQVLREYPDLRLISIEGHADRHEGGRARLARARAFAVRDVLVKLGVAPERLFAVGMGERFPLTMGQSADERARNRRAEFYILLRDDELMHAVRPEYVAEIAKRTGQPTWPLEAAVGRDTLGRDAAAGRAALERAIDGAPGIAERLTIFDAPVIAALPERYRALVREAALAQIPPPASAAEPYWTTLVALPAGASGPDGAAEQAAIEKTLGLLLAPLADPAVRWQAPAWQISASADALERLGRHDEAARRRSELAEKSAPR